jgi:hypothetical protein
MSLEALSLSALSLGFLHGLGADHLMAIAAMSVGAGSNQPRFVVVRTAIGFACGHALVLGTGAVAAVLLGIVLPAALSSGAERMGGALLVAMGVAGFWSVTSGRAYGHVHTDGTPPAQWHLHVSPPGRHPAAGHRHSFLPTAMGALFAVSSLRALMLLQPFGGDARSLGLPSLLLLVVLFGLGILFSMSLFGVVLSRVLSSRAVERAGRAAAAAVALASIALGFYWMFL